MPGWDVLIFALLLPRTFAAGRRITTAFVLEAIVLGLPSNLWKDFTGLRFERSTQPTANPFKCVQDQ